MIDALIPFLEMTLVILSTTPLSCDYGGCFFLNGSADLGVKFLYLLFSSLLRLSVCKRKNSEASLSVSHGTRKN
jgi:hypothetical protein